jgi:hypothetical protein
LAQLELISHQHTPFHDPSPGIDFEHNVLSVLAALVLRLASVLHERASAASAVSALCIRIFQAAHAMSHAAHWMSHAAHFADERLMTISNIPRLD